MKKDFDRAIADFSRAIALEPDHPGPRLYRGVTYLTWEGEPGKMLLDFTAVIHLDPGSADAFSARGLAWQKQQAYAMARSDYDEAERLDPNEWSLFLNRARIRESPRRPFSRRLHAPSNPLSRPAS